MALDVIGKSSFVLDPPEGYTDAFGIANKLNEMFGNDKIGFGATFNKDARAEFQYGKIVLNPSKINLGLCPLCDLPGTLFHEGVHAFYGDYATTRPIENRARQWQYRLEMSLYTDPSIMVKPLSMPSLHQVR